MEKPAAKSRKDLLWTSTTYFGEGLPWSFLHQMGAEFLTAIGASNAQVGMTSALHGAVTLKFLWSPIVDLFGRKRTWLWLMQIILGLGMLVVAAIVPSRNLTLFWTALAVLAILHATHDIACDGFYLQALDRRGRRCSPARASRRSGSRRWWVRRRWSGSPITAPGRWRSARRACSCCSPRA